MSQKPFLKTVGLDLSLTKSMDRYPWFLLGSEDPLEVDWIHTTYGSNPWI